MLLVLQIDAIKSFHACPEFLPYGPHKIILGMFEILSFRFITILFIKISNSPCYPMEKPETSIIWKTSDHKAKQSLGLLGYLQSTYG